MSWVKRFKKGYGISLLVPYHNDHQSREVNWRWLKRYWERQLPGAEIVIGDDCESPFSKSVAVNCAEKRATGDVFVIIDADAYIKPEVILEAAFRIRKARKKHRRLWFVPYRRFFRLKESISKTILESPPDCPYEIPDPPPITCVFDSSGSNIGHWYGAMLQIMPREAFELVGGFDERFRGWGGEDHAFMRAVDTLYWKHKTLPSQILHIWHPMLSPKGSKEWVVWKDRMWTGQSGAGVNDALSGRYYGAYGSYEQMCRLVNEGIEFAKQHRQHHHHKHHHHHGSV
jgi:hypothetical protein